MSNTAFTDEQQKAIDGAVRAAVGGIVERFIYSARYYRPQVIVEYWLDTLTPGDRERVIGAMRAHSDGVIDNPNSDDALIAKLAERLDTLSHILINGEPTITRRDGRNVITGIKIEQPGI